MKFFLFETKSYAACVEALRELRRPLLFVLVFLSLCLFVLMTFWDESVFVARVYHALSLGMDMDTVDYVIGKPDRVGTGSSFKDYEQEKRSDKNFSLRDYKIWHYADGVRVEFNHTNQVIKVSCYGTFGNNRCEPLFGLKIGDAEDLLTAKLGEQYESKLQDGKKIIYYPSLNAQFELEKRKIIGLQLSDFADPITQ